MTKEMKTKGSEWPEEGWKKNIRRLSYRCATLIQVRQKMSKFTSFCGKKFNPGMRMFSFIILFHNLFYFSGFLFQIYIFNIISGTFCKYVSII